MARTEVRFAGFGGQGIVTMGKILGKAAALHDDQLAVLTEDYGPEKMGGWSKADLVLSDEEVYYPLVKEVDILVVMSQDGMERYVDSIKVDATIIHEAELVDPSIAPGRKAYPIPALRTATEMGKKVVANIIMLGAFAEITGKVSPDAVLKSVLESVPKGTEELNEKAFKRGRELAKEVAA
jgi:2-oxoglutarate ferredoxin oxidoreductase subunit gamma